MDEKKVFQYDELEDIFDTICKYKKICKNKHFYKSIDIKINEIMIVDDVKYYDKDNIIDIFNKYIDIINDNITYSIDYCENYDRQFFILSNYFYNIYKKHCGDISCDEIIKNIYEIYSKIEDDEISEKVKKVFDKVNNLVCGNEDYFFDCEYYYKLNEYLNELPIINKFSIKENQKVNNILKKLTEFVSAIYKIKFKFYDDMKSNIDLLDPETLIDINIIDKFTVNEILLRIDNYYEELYEDKTNFESLIIKIQDFIDKYQKN